MTVSAPGTCFWTNTPTVFEPKSLVTVMLAFLVPGPAPSPMPHPAIAAATTAAAIALNEVLISLPGTVRS